MVETKDDIKLKFSKHLFWDIDIDDLDLDKHESYVINRVLDYGLMNDWRLIKKYYGLDRIKNVALDIRSMFPESLAFIANITHTPENLFRCYEQIQSPNPHWNF